MRGVEGSGKAKSSKAADEEEERVRLVRRNARPEWGVASRCVGMARVWRWAIVSARKRGEFSCSCEGGPLKRSVKNRYPANSKWHFELADTMLTVW
jgi:hypothetical protein